MEYSSIEKFIRNSLHPYSQGIIGSTLDVGTKEVSLRPIPGNPPNLINPPIECRFHPRCQYTLCKEIEPKLEGIEDSHKISCHLVKGIRLNA
ncbi:MAG: hypothetical protein NZ841_04435 [Dictyoglomus sp.]|nr:hypothetical protein [Dictyoglomus sp.]MCX7942504.1 hypothetical protein [Dictyoglomaceae bacterium]MDW8188524.1 hypothetical protein [Dictyoglomus sp.]